MTAALVFALFSWKNPLLADTTGQPWSTCFVLATVPGFLAVEHLAWRWLPTPRAAQTIYGIAVLFAAVHPWPTPIPLFFLGLGLGYLAFRTQSLVTPTVLHGL